VASAVLALVVAVGAWHVVKPLPPGVHVRGEYVGMPDASVRFLADVTAQDGAGGRIQRRAIHEATLELVRGARGFLVLDYFLFNGQGGPKGPLLLRDGLAPVSDELVAALRELKRSQPGLPVLVVTDPINDYYRGTPPPALGALREAGIDVVVTRLAALRDPNPVYSAPWRTLAGWWLPTRGEGRLPNVLDGAGPRLKAGPLLRLPNFKANHRKLAITGDGGGSLVGIVASANPHDASSAHSNVALRIEGEALRPLLDSELAVARFSGWQGGELERIAAARPAPAPAGGPVQVAVITEGAIRDALLERFAAARAGNAIDIAQFYLAERRVTGALLAAAARGVQVRVLLDPNRDAFGFEKSGIPNRPVGSALLRRGEGRIALRWYRTSGEQFHSKYAAVRSGDTLWFTLGSANFTRRNIGDFNLEANVEVLAPMGSMVARESTGWFEMLWGNAGGIPYTDPPETWAEDSLLRLWQAGFMEATGLSTF
jgi:phosphatidylserine/phosphatidylglycerophosphate/cardiolipin synthase-like enzyme